MACNKCGRTGLCSVCCCSSNDHYGHLPNLFECRTCKHPTRLKRKRSRPGKMRIRIAGRR